MRSRRHRGHLLLRFEHQQRRSRTGLKVADPIHQFVQEEQQGVVERNVFAEGDEMLFVIAAENLSIRREQIGAVEQKRAAVGISS